MIENGLIAELVSPAVTLALAAMIWTKQARALEAITKRVTGVEIELAVQNERGHGQAFRCVEHERRIAELESQRKGREAD